MRLIQKPDWDPNNPYHYHVNGKKVVITPEDWEKYKDDPTFREVRAAVEAEQAAHPGPEYDEIENPAWKIAYQRIGVSSPNYWNGSKYVQSPLPNGYSRDKRGVAIDANGNYYAPVKDMSYSNSNVPFFVNNERSSVNGNTVPVRYEQVQMPARTIRQLRQPLPVDKVMNVQKALNTLNQIKVPAYYYKTVIPENGVFSYRFNKEWENDVYELDPTVRRGKDRNRNDFLVGIKNTLKSDQTDTLSYKLRDPRTGQYIYKSIPIKASNIRNTGLNSVKSGVKELVDKGTYNPTGNNKTRETTTVWNGDKIIIYRRFRLRDKAFDDNRPTPLEYKYTTPASSYTEARLKLYNEFKNLDYNDYPPIDVNEAIRLGYWRPATEPYKVKVNYKRNLTNDEKAKRLLENSYAKGGQLPKSESMPINVSFLDDYLNRYNKINNTDLKYESLASYLSKLPFQTVNGESSLLYVINQVGHKMN